MQLGHRSESIGEPHSVLAVSAQLCVLRPVAVLLWVPCFAWQAEGLGWMCSAGLFCSDLERPSGIIDACLWVGGKAFRVLGELCISSLVRNVPEALGAAVHAPQSCAEQGSSP